MRVKETHQLIRYINTKYKYMKGDLLYGRRWISPKKKARQLLRLLFKLKPWHDYPLNEKPYAMWALRNIPEFVNENNSALVFVEIGCGLGDVIGNINIKGMKIGYDTTKETIKCARLLHPFTCFRVGSFDECTIGNIDLLILLNFMHCISEDEIRNKIQRLVKDNNVKIVCFDTFLNESVDYPVVHRGERILGDSYYCVKPKIRIIVTKLLDNSKFTQKQPIALYSLGFPSVLCYP